MKRTATPFSEKNSRKAPITINYSPEGTCWDYFPHDHARSRTYRWGEDGLLGITDRQCRLCFALALWNGCAPILKERLFDLTGPEGNHGEDVKEVYHYLDSTPTHAYLIEGRADAVNPEPSGTKAALHYTLRLEPGEMHQVRLRLAAGKGDDAVSIGSGFDEVLSRRIRESDEFYAAVLPDHLTAEARTVARQAYAGLLWTKWTHLYNRDILSVPDKWEYPWFAAWDPAFHMPPLSRIDPQFAKEQLVLLLREWYMHPNGQIPAYEFAFGDVNSPVHAWAAWRVYKICAPKTQRDRDFLERYHHHYGCSLKVELPTGSGRWCNLQQVADEISRRQIRLFLPDEKGQRPCHGDPSGRCEYPGDKDFVLFHEYFDGDTGKCLGASHQTG